MKERIKEYKVYISEDGLEFNDIESCLQHEQSNAFSKDMERIPKITNLPFINGMSINGYWCETQAHLDCCISWWIESQKTKGITCVTKQIFLKPDYYFILFDINNSDIMDGKYAYNFLPYSYLQQQWDNFTKQIPVDPYTYNVMQEIREKYYNLKKESNINNIKPSIKNEKVNKNTHVNLLDKLNQKTKKKGVLI